MANLFSIIASTDRKRQPLESFDGSIVAYTHKEALIQIECFSKTAAFGIPSSPQNFSWVIEPINS